ncbi:MAG TPA: DUF6174 domain-containing protein [Longimicrobium sp.]|nr:DUF6174 domain-containing protein [Longimicrobium sp.]
MIRRIRPLILALALAACDSPTESADVALEVHRRIWERQGIDDYRYELTRYCFCARLDVGVQVRDGQVVEVRDMESGQVLPQERWEEVRTVDQLFESIRRARERGEFDEVRYHPTLGYPLYADLDNSPDDGGVVYEVIGLHRVE